MTAPTPPRRDAGFVLVAILLVVGVVASIAASYSRHVIVYSQASSVSGAALEADEVIDSQIEYMLQSQRAGQAFSAAHLKSAIEQGLVGAGDVGSKHQTTIDVSDISDERSSLMAKVIAPNGMGATRLMETRRIPAARNIESDTLPGLKEPVRQAVLSDVDVPKITIDSSRTIENTDLEGVIIINSGITLTLRNVVVRGAIVSQTGMMGLGYGAFSEFLAPQLIIGGSVRIKPDSFLDGLAIHMPDGVVSSTGSEARFDTTGDMVAHAIALRCPGATAGHIATVRTPILDAGFEQIGVQRGPSEWSPTLDFRDSWETMYVAFLPRSVEVGDLEPITDYVLPEDKAPADSSGGEDDPDQAGSDGGGND